MTNLNFFNFVSKDFLKKFAKTFEGSFLFLELFLFIFSLVKIKSFFGAVLKFMSIKIFELLNDVLVNRVNHVDDF